MVRFPAPIFAVVSLLTLTLPAVASKTPRSSAPARPVARKVSSQELAKRAAMAVRTGCLETETFAACLAPGTPASYARKVLAHLPPLPKGTSFQYYGRRRWEKTVNNASTGPVGTPITLTYSFVPDGVSIPGTSQGDSTSANVLFAKMNAKFGSTATWKALFKACFDRWSAVSGVKYQEVTDDGAAFDNATSPGSLNPSRGDIRIAMHSIDGASGILAYNYYPNSGDMVLDADDMTNFGDSTDNYRVLRNVVMHEHGHGLGYGHVWPMPGDATPGGGTKLMEPYLSLSIDGPQDDDIRGGTRFYGDAKEPNQTAGTATNLGTLSGTQTFENLALSTSTDEDWFVFNTTPNTALSVKLVPVGSAYSVGNSSTAVTPVDSAAINNLNFAVYASNGTTLLASGNTQPAGTAEEVKSIDLSTAGSKAYIKVVNASNPVDDTQRYQLILTVAAPLATISGEITLLNSLNPAQPITFTFRPKNGGATFSKQATLGAGGSFTLTDIAFADYNLAIKGAKWLQKVVGVNASGGNVAGVTASLNPGDADNDNHVNIFDLATLAEDFNSGPNDANWNGGRSDFNCDDSTDIFDLAILAEYFNTDGDL